jgi:hypothetical protein
MTPATSTANADVPPRHKLSTGWKVFYTLLLAGVGTGIFFVSEWWQKGAVLLLLVLSALRILNTEREQVTSLRGACRYCGTSLTENDRECPSCERTVPKEQRLGMRK